MSQFLVIDDDEMMCERFSLLIESLGHDATCVFTLEQGIEKSRKALTLFCSTSA